MTGSAEFASPSTGSDTTSSPQNCQPPASEPPTADSDSSGVPSETQVCKKCGISKPFSEFYKSKLWLSGYRTTCKVCVRSQETARKKLAEVKTKNSETHCRYRRTHRAKVLVNLARHRAKIKEIPFEIDAQGEGRLQQVIDAGLCQLTGIPFNLDDGKTWDSPSLDRIDNSKGYSLENVRVVLYCVNVMANLWGENKIVEIAGAIMERRREWSESLQTRLSASLKNMLPLESPEFSMKWAERPMSNGQSIPALVASARRTAANDSSGWPSPNVPNGGRQAAPESMTSTGKKPDGRKGQVDLNFVAQMASWSTPAANEYENSDPAKMMERRRQCQEKHVNGNGFGLTLGMQMSLVGWPTANSTDHKGVSTRSDGPPPRDINNRLKTDRQTRTPGTPGSYKMDLGDQAGLASGPIPGSSPAPTASRGVLNPEFSRWLMGFPKNWGHFLPGWASWDLVQKTLRELSGRPVATETRP